MPWVSATILIAIRVGGGEPLHISVRLVSVTEVGRQDSPEYVTCRPKESLSLFGRRGAHVLRWRPAAHAGD